MTAEIINLRRARKARNRRDAEARAAENRVAFGRSKAERQATDAAKALERRRLDAMQLEQPSSADTAANEEQMRSARTDGASTVGASDDHDPPAGAGS